MIRITGKKKIRSAIGATSNPASAPTTPRGNKIKTTKRLERITARIFKGNRTKNIPVWNKRAKIFRKITANTKISNIASISIFFHSPF